MQAGAKIATISAEDKMRADLYGLLGNILYSPPTNEILTALKSLSGDETEMGQAFDTLTKLSSSTGLDSAIDEYNGLFIGVGRGELLPYCSYYLTGFLNEKPLAKLRNSMRELGIARNEDVKEPEDHIGSLMEMMAGLIVGRYGEPASIATQKEFFEAHIQPWADHFFRDLEAAKLSKLYQPIGKIGQLFIEIETNAFSME